MANLVNTLMLAELEHQFQGHEGGVFVDFSGISVQQVNVLRTKFEESDVTFRVLKNRIAKRVFSSLDLDVSDILVGPTAYAFGSADQAIGAAKVIDSLRKELKTLRVKGAIFEREVLDDKAALALAKLPDRFTMQSMIAIALSGSARGVATCINGVAAGLARCLQARIDKEEDGESAGGESADS